MTLGVVILGAGFAGLELATRLADDVPDDVAVTLIDESDAFVFGYSKLDVMFGHQPIDAVRVPYRDISKPGIVIAEGEAGTVADVLVHRIRGGAAPPPFPGIVSCYIEFGGGRVARFSANLTTGPAPTSEFLEASVELAVSEREFGASRRERWFG